MPAILAIIMRVTLPLLAGLGIGELIDKFRIPIPENYKPVRMPFKTLINVAVWSVVAYFVLKILIRKLKLGQTIKL